MVVVSWLTITHTTPIVQYRISFWGDGVLGGLGHYDGGWYYIISEQGYSYAEGMQSPVAFFPGYPLAMRYVGGLLWDDAVGGIVVTSLAGLGTAILYWRWTRERLAAAAATCALLAYLFYPYGYYFYGVIYADALFVFATLLAFWAVEHDRPVLAGVAGALATFTRPVGIAVVVGIVVRTLERRGALHRPGWLTIPTRVRWSALKPKDGFVLLSLSGLIAYCVFLWHKWGDPLLFSSVERYWGQEPGPETWLKFDLYDQVRNHWDSVWTWGAVFQGGLALLMLATVPLVVRRFGWGYGAYLFVVLLIPIVGTKDFQGMGRYGMAAFPVFALVGQFLAERPPAQRRLALACSAGALLVAGAGFAHGYYIT